MDRKEKITRKVNITLEPRVINFLRTNKFKRRITFNDTIVELIKFKLAHQKKKEDENVNA